MIQQRLKKRRMFFFCKVVMKNYGMELKEEEEYTEVDGTESKGKGG